MSPCPTNPRLAIPLWKTSPRRPRPSWGETLASGMDSSAKTGTDTDCTRFLSPPQNAGELGRLARTATSPFRRWNSSRARPWKAASRGNACRCARCCASAGRSPPAWGSPGRPWVWPLAVRYPVHRNRRGLVDTVGVDFSPGQASRVRSRETPGPPEGIGNRGSEWGAAVTRTALARFPAPPTVCIAWRGGERTGATPPPGVRG
jgi:hypothetical protein